MGVGLRWLSLIRNTQQSTESWRPQSGIEGLIKRRRGRGGECGGGLVVEFVTKKQNTEQPTQNRQQQLRWKMVLRGDVNRGELGGGGVLTGIHLLGFGQEQRTLAPLISTVRIVREFRGSPTQPPQLTSSTWCAVCPPYGIDSTNCPNPMRGRPSKLFYSIK